MDNINETIGGGSMDNMFLTFNVGEEKYGIEIRYVLQIVGMQPVTRMPDMPPGMQGFINLRGDVIPVTSLRRLLGYGDGDSNGGRACIIVVQRGGKRTAGLAVDLINETLTIPPEQIAASPVHARQGGGYVMGVAQLGDMKTAVLLDVPKLLEA